MVLIYETQQELSDCTLTSVKIGMQARHQQKKYTIDRVEKNSLHL